MITPKDRNEKVDGFVILYIAVSEEIDGEGLGRYLRGYVGFSSDVSLVV
jgi:hypothetical protein